MSTVAITSTQLDVMLAETRRLRAGFANNADRSWDSTTAAAEMTVQLGHLAQCVRRDVLTEPVPVDEQRPITDAGDELADVLLSALSIWTLSAGPPRDQELRRALLPRVTEPPPADQASALLRLVSEAGTLAEVAMIESSYRHRPGGEVPSLPEAVAVVVQACLTFGWTGGLDLIGEFFRMARDADAFLARAHSPPVQPGEFSTHERSGARVVKKLEADHLTRRALPLPMNAEGTEELRCYVDTLQAAGVRLPVDLAIPPATPLSVSHTWVDGPTLAQAATADPASVVRSIHEIASWVRTLDVTGARIDTNLANFCLVDGAPILVDVLPPLIVNRRPASRNLFEELFDSLCFDTPVTLDALAAYAMTRLLLTGNQNGWAAAGCLAELAETLMSNPPHPGLGGSWFRARLRLATRCAAGQASVTQLRSFSAATSVLTFHRFNEQTRHDRAAAVRRQIHDLGLGDA